MNLVLTSARPVKERPWRGWFSINRRRKVMKETKLQDSLREIPYHFLKSIVPLS
jgi:hypothetical protein